jgi:triphosphoribosyl-dephospho-CoA synthetase
VVSENNDVQEALRNMAAAVSFYYRELISGGVEADHAMMLVQEYQQFLLDRGRNPW